MPARRAAAVLVVALAIALAVALYRLLSPAAAEADLASVGLRPARRLGAMINVAAAVPAFLKSCAVVTARGDDEPFDPVPKSSDFGTVGEWRALCAAAATLAARRCRGEGFLRKQFRAAAGRQ